MAVYDYYDPWKYPYYHYKFFIFDYTIINFTNPSNSTEKYKIIYEEFLNFLSYKLDGKYYMLYTLKLQNILNETLLRYQIHIEEITENFTEPARNLDLLDFYPDMQFI